MRVRDRVRDRVRVGGGEEGNTGEETTPQQGENDHHEVGEGEGEGRARPPVVWMVDGGWWDTYIK